MEKPDMVFNGHDGYDAVVVGSGYGGSVAACRLSMAGVKVCLVEKGQKWEAKDFPTNSFNIISALRMESQNLGVSFGPKDALFQVYEQNDSLAAMACGLGGGSLVNAGVTVPTPVRTRRSSKWPKEWETDWDSCEASAATMMRIQSVPLQFPIAKIMKLIDVGEVEHMVQDSIKLSMNFDIEDSSSRLPKHQNMDTCIGCGNCLAGCPYNAKNSTDKNYLASAIQAWCQAHYVVKKSYETDQNGEIGGKRRRLVYLNDMDYIKDDFVIFSAGVFGTTAILFNSQMRGLKLSKALGSGFSCNGNTVAYLCGSNGPLNGYGLDKKQLSKIPIQARPGPSISSSYSSSLGFTIQSAVLPTAYPYLLFKGITTFGWPTGYWFFHGIIDKLKHLIGSKSSQAMVLLAMGHDKSDGKIILDKETNKIIFSPPHDPLLPQKVKAFQKITKKLGGILFMSRFRSASVLYRPVFDPEVPGLVHQGLYVCDASLIPCSVGVNPCLTIVAAAEHVCKDLVNNVLKYKTKTCTNYVSKVVDQNPHIETHDTLKSIETSYVSVKETLRGYIAGMPCTATLRMKINLQNSNGFDDWSYSIMRKSLVTLKGKVGGYVVFRAIEKDKLHVIDGEVKMFEVNYRTPNTQYMHYRLLLAAASGSRYVLEGKKIMNPYLFAIFSLKETTTLYVTFKRVSGNFAEDLLKTLLSLEGNGKVRFLHLFLLHLLRTYILQIPQGIHKEYTPTDSYNNSYPTSTFHELETGDGCIISCRRWNCSHSRLKFNEEKHPVLLLNGHSTENIGRYDIPAGNKTYKKVAMLTLLSARSVNFMVHVVAHRVGGLAIHIAVMGGHVSPTQIASLCCTNSSMFFKLSTLATVKMWLPLVSVSFPLNNKNYMISMALLGKNKTLPLLDTSKASLRHRLLMYIARWIPRYERCTCNECEVFSGIFGNTFWHQNLTPTMHHWLNKQSTTKLPMAAFPHLRKICKSGFIVDSKGNNSYLIHPERMAVLLVTPETTFLANKYVKLHQPGFRHERVVVDGFGHSDLLIGEESCKEVFPYIVSHIRLCEEGKDIVMINKEKKDGKEALDWAADPYHGYGGSESCLFSPLLVLSSGTVFNGGMVSNKSTSSGQRCSELVLETTTLIFSQLQIKVR
ncbi:hypothetical protein CXB51_002373 [Gossypium anomalum]|uniref:4Fe-4S ferredoxin-type domain-containing protein n=1 Tax=Gossypium anomalum TaxID=47600 RepID=A0A8J5ZL83_9ROSI|nr:hypothetical protein CXB51_002373 [Gossypium anomalum]